MREPVNEGPTTQFALSEVVVPIEADDAVAFQVEMHHIAFAGPKLAPITLTVYPFQDMEMVKHVLLKKLGPSFRTLKISDVEVFYKGQDVPNRRMMIAFGDSNLVKFTWRLKEKIGRGTVLKAIRERGEFRMHPKQEGLMQQIALSMQRNINPKLASEGTGGTYMLSDVSYRPVAVFKPTDEEPFAPNNPRNYPGKLGQKGFREGVVSGEGAAREVAAFLLDAYYGHLSGVPATSMVEMVHPHFCYDPDRPNATRQTDTDALHVDGQLKLRRKKNPDKDKERSKDREKTDKGSKEKSKSNENRYGLLAWKSGSLQEFIQAKESCSDYEPSLFSIGDVHKVAILDIRLANMDRNEGNVLVLKTEDADLFRLHEDLLKPSFYRKYPSYEERACLTPEGKASKFRLIPIDHGLTLPDCLDITDFDLGWLYWPQAHIPFFPEEVEYTKNLDPDTDAEWLSRKLSIRPVCLRVMQCTTRLLKKGVLAGLTAHQIGMQMVRMSPEQPSPVEKAIKVAVSQAVFAMYAISMVHKRDPSIKYAMDLAEGKHMDSLAPKLKVPANTEFDASDRLFESKDSSLSGMLSGGSRSNARSSTVRAVGFSRAAGEPATAKERIMSSFTAWRTRDLSSTTNDLWMVQDAGGRPITPAWDNPKFRRLFFESYETVLDFMIAERKGKKAVPVPE